MSNDIEPNSCRICFKEEKEMLSIYKPVKYNNKTPSEMLQEVAGIVLEEVFEKPVLPKNICHSCIQSLNQAFRFRRKILESQRIISNHLLKDNENALLQVKQELEEDEILTDEEFQYLTETEQVRLDKQFCDNETVESEEQVGNIIVDLDTEEKCVQNNVIAARLPSGNYLSDSMKNSSNAEENLNENDSVANVESTDTGRTEDCEGGSCCDVCGKRFAYRYNMVRHRQLHDEEPRYGCNQCDKRFKVLEYLNKHKTVHSDHRPHVCDVCSKAFKVAIALKKHKSTHTGIRLHHCKYCNRNFLRRRILLRHEKTKKHQHAVASAESQN